jgi:hypothetical protein
MQYNGAQQLMMLQTNISSSGFGMLVVVMHPKLIPKSQ